MPLSMVEEAQGLRVPINDNRPRGSCLTSEISCLLLEGWEDLDLFSGAGVF